jgi:glucose-1-phosphate thymidylyltransferase
VAVVLGDNIFFGHGLPELLAKAAACQRGATVFAYHVRDPERYGVVTFDENDPPVSIEEKPTRPSSNWAITGLYFFDNDVVRHASEARPSARGELEITDLQTCYLSAGILHVERMGRGFAWLDTGTFESLIDAASFVQTHLKQGRASRLRVSRKSPIIGEKRLRELFDRRYPVGLNTRMWPAFAPVRR